MLSSLTLFSLLAVPALTAVLPKAQPATIELSSRSRSAGRMLSTSSRKYLSERAIIESTVPLETFFLGTDLQWYGNIQVGTPPQDVSVVFDTGSRGLEFASDQCDDSCTQPRFKTKSSSTYVNTGVSSNLSFTTGVGVDPVQHSTDYEMSLLAGTDVVSIGGLNAGSVNLSTITSQSKKFQIDPFMGIQGMGPNALGVFTAFVREGLPSLFCLYLTPKSSGRAAQLHIGGTDSTKYKGELTYAQLPTDMSGFWSLSSPQLFINGKSSKTLTESRRVIFDTGTSNVLFPTATTEEIYASISPDIKPFPAQPGTYGIACSKISTLNAVIDIGFTSTTGQRFNLTIPSNELSVGPFASDPTTCQTLINAFDGLSLVGGSLLKYYYSVWDVGNQRMGFAQSVL